MVQFPQAKIQEFFSDHTTKEALNGRRVGQAFYDFMGYDPTTLSPDQRMFLDRLYEMDGSIAAQFIHMHSDFGQ